MKKMVLNSSQLWCHVLFILQSLRTLPGSTRTPKAEEQHVEREEERNEPKKQVNKQQKQPHDCVRGARGEQKQRTFNHKPFHGFQKCNGFASKHHACNCCPHRSARGYVLTYVSVTFKQKKVFQKEQLTFLQHVGTNSQVARCECGGSCFSIVFLLRSLSLWVVVCVWNLMILWVDSKTDPLTS